MIYALLNKKYSRFHFTHAPVNASYIYTSLHRSCTKCCDSIILMSHVADEESSDDYTLSICRYSELMLRAKCRHTH